MKQLLHLVPILVLLQITCLAVVCITNRLRGLPQPRAFLLFTALLFAATWPPLSWVATGSLEWWYSTGPLPTSDADAIVILSGAANPPRPHRPVVHLGRDSYARCRHGAWLFKAWKELPVAVCGGRPEAGEGVRSLAAYMEDFLIAEGVPAEKILKEESSSTTHENALFTAPMLREQKLRTIALVTDGWHMPRAAASFRAQGLKVIPAPATLRSARFEGPLSGWLPSHHALIQNERVLHEWMGLAWYLLSGRL